MSGKRPLSCGLTLVVFDVFAPVQVVAQIPVRERHVSLYPIYGQAGDSKSVRVLMQLIALYLVPPVQNFIKACDGPVILRRVWR